MSGKKVNVHDTLIASLSRIPDNDVAVFLSGGIDSRSVVYGLLELGKRPHAYSFTLNGKMSRDFQMARTVAKQCGIPFTPVYLPTDTETLISDVYRLHDVYGCRKKTEYTCVFPFLYAYPMVKERYIADGMGADGHFCLSKKGMIHYRDRIDKFRREYWSKPNCGQKKQHSILAAKYGKILVNPYMERAMIDLFWGTSWEDVNKPKQKQPILDAFPKEFAQYKVYPHTNLQLGDSGISAQFDKLLRTPLNRNGYKSVTGVLNDVNRGFRI